MQHIEELNKKSLDSQQKIYKGLRKLLLTKPLSEITVTDISEECDILRFKLLIIYNAIREVLEKEFGITQICVNKETDNWMFIS